MKKCEAILYMYSELMRHREISKGAMMEKCDIQPMTFSRYISEIRTYFMEHDAYFDVIYDRKNEKYRLIGDPTM